jgi:RTX calcium-binding nonapeptide repeat (4 copies)
MVRPGRPVGAPGADVICGGAGDDVLRGASGDDAVYGGPATTSCAAARAPTA